MAVTAFIRRWSPALQSMAVLVALAIITRYGPSANVGATSYDVHGYSASVQAAQVVACHALASAAAKVVRFSGPWLVSLSSGRAIASGRVRGFSHSRFAPPSTAIESCYDATAPPGMLPT